MPLRKEKKEKRLSRLAGWFRRLSTDKLDKTPGHVRGSDSVSSMPVPHTVTGVVADRRHSYNDFGSRPAPEAAQSLPAGRAGYTKSLLSNGFTLPKRSPPTIPATPTTPAATDTSGALQRLTANSEGTHETASGSASDRTVGATPTASLLSGDAVNGLALAVTHPPSTAITPPPSIAASSVPSLHALHPASRLPRPVAAYSRSASSAPSRSSRETLRDRDVQREALRQSLRLRVADPTRPVVDHQRQPVVIISLLALLDKRTLLAFRLTCRRHAALVNELYGAHVVVKGGAGGYHAASALGRAPVCYNGRPFGRGRPYLAVVGRVGVLSFEGGLRTWDLSERAEADAAEARLRRRLPRVADTPVVRVADLAFAFECDVRPGVFVWFQTEGVRETYVPPSTRRLVINLWGNWRFPILNYPDLELDEVVVHPSPWIRKEDWAFRAECVAVIARTLLLDLVPAQVQVPEVRVSGESEASERSERSEQGGSVNVNGGVASDASGASAASESNTSGGSESLPNGSAQAKGKGKERAPQSQPPVRQSAPRKDVRVTVVGFDPIDEARHAALPGYQRYSLPLVRGDKIGEWKRFTSAHEALGPLAELMGVLGRISFVSEGKYRAAVGERRWILETERDAAVCAARMRMAKT